MSSKKEKKEKEERIQARKSSFLSELGPPILTTPGSPPLPEKKSGWRSRLGHKRGVSEGNVIFDSEPISLEPRPRSVSEDKRPPSSMMILNPIMEGYIRMKTQKAKVWKKRFLVLDSDKLFIFKSAEETGTPKQIPLLLSQAKRYANKKNKFRFMVITRDLNWKFQIKTESEINLWVGGIQEVCNSLTIGSIDVNKIDPQQRKKELFEIMKLPGNGICADCSEKDPDWASTNLGIFICIQCSGLHRNLGTHISKVRSVTLDSWDEQQIRRMKIIGNIRANKVWEVSIPYPFEKPIATSNMQAKLEWIQAKYELGLFKQVNQSIEEEEGEEDEEKDEKKLKEEEYEWTEAIAPDGRKYYWNKKTRERRWKKPMDSTEMWKKAITSDGKTYFYHIETKERKWKNPNVKLEKEMEVLEL
eukprot:TRINITY_DN11726_c0_g1_i1.p1 TRINITY_DN11726_c0_g1~~TRINITY_DN11726_c0_g1_i1.p1  ORF type:complete len:416 (-),score=111.04 TRINITY_DN11726_c0_g1_i1:6-1253(-)